MSVLYIRSKGKMKETKKFSLKAAMKGKSMMFCSLLLILAMAVMFFQNEKMLIKDNPDK